MVIQQTEPVTKIQQKRVCSRCNVALDRIQRGFLVKTFLSWLPFKHYICYRCHKKSYSFGR